MEILATALGQITPPQGYRDMLFGGSPPTLVVLGVLGTFSVVSWIIIFWKIRQFQALRMVLEKGEAEEQDDLSRGLPWLSIIGSTAPLLGLLGTVIGVMNAFLGIAATGSTNIGAVAPGMAEALITTVVGLFVAIPAVIGYNHFVAQLNFFRGELEGFSSEFIGTLAREGRI